MQEAGLWPPVFRDRVKPIASYTDVAFGKWLDALAFSRGTPPRQNPTAKVEPRVVGGDAAATKNRR